MNCGEALNNAEKMWRIGEYMGKEVIYVVKEGEDPTRHRKIDCGDKIILVRGPLIKRA